MKIRFASVVDVAYNYYSSGDEVLEILDGMPGTFSGGILHLNRYTWHKQEIFKGTHGLGSSDWAGWGFHRNILFQRYYSLSEANALSNSVLRTAQVFKHDPSELFQTNMTNAKITEYSTTKVPAIFFRETTIDDDDNVVLVPRSCFAFVSGATNLQPVNDDLYVPRQFGPLNSNGVDVFENAIETALGNRVRFIDCWNVYHVWRGEIHCGSNVKREKLNINWWENL